MSADLGSNIKTVHVHLLDEGTTVIRPTRAVRLADNTYRLLPTPNYDPDDEHWQFLPGSVVYYAAETWDGCEVLVARELATNRE